jgi:hypothetical protein
VVGFVEDAVPPARISSDESPKPSPEDAENRLARH